MSLTTTFALALAASGSLVAAAPPPSATGSGTPSSTGGAYELIADYSGPEFFDHFTFFTDKDPTNGHVKYVDMETARQEQYIGYVYNSATNKTSAYVGVDHTNQAPNGRNSVRLLGKDSFNAGSMVVIDTNHIPVGDGLWPAIWLLGANWPNQGESDIIEYVHETAYNGMALHTGPGCQVQNVANSFQGQFVGGNCSEGDSILATTGCSIKAKNQNQLAGTKTKIATAGFKMNQQGGGVYVHDWQPDSITVWMFPHGGLPKDLVAGKPNPSSWKQKPLAKFQGDCDFSKSFKDMGLIINIDFCGDWAGKTWEEDGAAKRTGVATCNEYVANNPKAFKDAYFDIGSIKFYSNNGQKPGSLVKRSEPVWSEKRHEGFHDMPLFPNTTSTGHPSTSTHNCTNMTMSRGVFERDVQTSGATETETVGWLLAAGRRLRRTVWA